MACLTPMTLDEAAALAVQFGLGPVVELLPIVKGSVNSNFCLRLEGNERVFLRVCEESDFDAVCVQNTMLATWVRQGVTTPAPLLLASAAGSVARHRGKPVTAFPFRPGESVCQRLVSAAHLERIGAELSRIHSVGRDLVAQAPPSRFSMADLLQRLPQVRATERPELVADCALLEPRIHELMTLANAGADVVHGDLFRDNVLWHDPSDPTLGLSAVLDFESASKGSRLFDLMVTLLAWCFGDSMDWSLVSALMRGYCRHTPLNQPDLEACYHQARAACVRFAVTRMTDYELRSESEVAFKDYRRFMQRLNLVEELGPDGFVTKLSPA